MQSRDETKPLLRGSSKSSVGPFFVGILAGALFVVLAQTVHGSMAPQMLTAGSLSSFQLNAGPRRYNNSYGNNRTHHFKNPHTNFTGPEVIQLHAKPKFYSIAYEPSLNNQSILSGHPDTQTTTQFSGQIAAGTWEAERGSWNHTQHGDEFVQLLEGKMTLTRFDGQKDRFEAPISFIIPDGWTGVWEVNHRVKKFWVMTA